MKDWIANVLLIGLSKRRVLSTELRDLPIDCRKRRVFQSGLVGERSDGGLVQVQDASSRVRCVVAADLVVVIACPFWYIWNATCDVETGWIGEWQSASSTASVAIGKLCVEPELDRR